MSATALALSLAIVTQDPVALRAAPRDSAPQQAQLWQGDSLEVRGARGDFLQVWDHRRERGGYIRATQARTLDLAPEHASDLLAVVHFVRDEPGEEALGIAYAAAFLKAAPAQQITPDVFDAIGTMADRLARRASQKRGKSGDAETAEHIGVLANYGVAMTGFERDGRVQLCYDGDAFRRVLAYPDSTPQQRARAALGLTRHDCLSPNLTPLQRSTLDNERLYVLSHVDLSGLASHIRNRVLMRRAGVEAAIVYEQQRLGESPQDMADHAIADFAAIDKAGLTEDDALAYNDAATRVGVARWAASDAAYPASTLTVKTHTGNPGETCVQLVDTKQKSPLMEKCTYGFVYPASAAANAQHTALALSVQTLDTWRELWLFRKGDDGWFVDVIPPSANGPLSIDGNIGYVDFAGWVPGKPEMLTAREVLVDGRYQHRFEVTNMDSLKVEHWTDRPESLTPFYRWQSPGWKRVTLMLR